MGIYQQKRATLLQMAPLAKYIIAHSSIVTEVEQLADKAVGMKATIKDN
jgi:hypothetical protein